MAKTQPYGYLEIYHLLLYNRYDTRICNNIMTITLELYLNIIYSFVLKINFNIEFILIQKFIYF